jgi:hypothetical protein
MSRQLKCALCGGDLETGSVEIKGTPLGFLMVGLSWQHLWFSADLFDTKIKVLKSAEQRRAYQCTSCCAVVVPNLI